MSDRLGVLSSQWQLRSTGARTWCLFQLPSAQAPFSGGFRFLHRQHTPTAQQIKRSKGLGPQLRQYAGLKEASMQGRSIIVWQGYVSNALRKYIRRMLYAM